MTDNHFSINKYSGINMYLNQVNNKFIIFVYKLLKNIFIFIK